jgi:hypothetical protein
MKTFDTFKKIIKNKILLVYKYDKEIGLRRVSAIYVFHIDEKHSLENLNRHKKDCEKNVAVEKEIHTKKVTTTILVNVLVALIIWLLLYFLNRYLKKKYFSIKNNDRNTPLSGEERLKVGTGLTLFAILTFIAIGVVPLILTILSIYFLKIDKSSNFLEKSKKRFNSFLYLVNVLSIAIVTYITVFEISPYKIVEDGIIAIYIYVGIYASIILVRYLYRGLIYKPLLSHDEWIKDNGIFTKKTKNSSKFIKRDNLSSFSISDELLKWNELYEKGIITKEEFEKRKEKLLNQEKL